MDNNSEFTCKPIIIICSFYRHLGTASVLDAFYISARREEKNVGHLLMILSDNYYSQRKPTSILDTDMGGVPYFCAAEREICPIY